ncbi:MAG: acyltransferase [Muribaculaceae bacterium]|nr:acyltransferase [Muribaculaceae bacterium]
MTDTVKTQNRQRIAWLAVLQGFSMLLVVLGHISLSNTFRNPDYPLTAAMERVIYTFHMPLFIFISGWLFGLTCLGRDNSYRDVMAKKFRRLGLPFLFFTIAAIAIKLLLSAFVNRPVDGTELLNTFVLFSSNPLYEMWFVIVLLVLMAFYPAYRFLLRHSALVWLLCASVALYVALPVDTDVFQLRRAVRLLPYFIAGILAWRYDIIDRYGSRWYVAAGAMVLFVIFNILETGADTLGFRCMDALCGFSGTVLSICLCIWISNLRPTAFGSFSAYTFQIFLMGIFVQMAVRVLYGHLGTDSDAVYALLFALSLALGIYVPVLIAKLIERKMPRLKKFFGL